MGIFFMFGFGTNMIFMLAYDGKYANCPDIALGVLVLVFVLVGIYKSFWKRGFHTLAWLSIAVVIPYIAVQFTELPWLADFFDKHARYDDLRWASNISFKIMLCMLFMALIVSWMYEKAGGKASLKIRAPYEKDGRSIFEIQISFGCSVSKPFELTEKGYLRVLEIAQKYREKGGPIKTNELYHKSATSIDEIRQDLTKILEKTKIDPLFARPGEGLRGFQAVPADVIIDPDIRNRVSWENVEFAKAVLGDSQNKEVFERGLKVKEAHND
ncbi:MAG: hypothetical protein DMG65_12885 [Candidatus Angelobacter sp. Gp1-AA117]|nr:MAG: hypothetical protein DMG65_12885 [Candidatus Angelobacter sp. Gp1-AA117]